MPLFWKTCGGKTHGKNKSLKAQGCNIYSTHWCPNQMLKLKVPSSATNCICNSDNLVWVFAAVEEYFHWYKLPDCKAFGSWAGRGWANKHSLETTWTLFIPFPSHPHASPIFEKSESMPRKTPFYVLLETKTKICLSLKKQLGHCATNWVDAMANLKIHSGEKSNKCSQCGFASA